MESIQVIFFVEGGILLLILSYVIFALSQLEIEDEPADSSTPHLPCRDGFAPDQTRNHRPT